MQIYFRKRHCLYIDKYKCSKLNNSASTRVEFEMEVKWYEIIITSALNFTKWKRNNGPYYGHNLIKLHLDKIHAAC